ncbi:MAG: CPBP family intramembrane metalloprotease [Novosphingobium sp.]|nr:CPBP family intramembrane metalloprotease [Novosphingobium sp.]
MIARDEAAKGWASLAGGVVVAVGWVVLAQHLGDSITIQAIGVAMTLYYALLFLPLVALAWGIGRLSRVAVLRVGDAPGWWTLIGALCGAGGLALTIAYAWLNGGLAPGPASAGGAGLVLLGAILTLLQVGAEELLFRGWLQPALIDKIGVPAGIAAGALLFSAFHLTAGVTAPLSFVNLALGGTWFGLLAWRSGGILAPIAAHYAWNVIEDSGLGLVPNPGLGPLGAVRDYDLSGSPLWGAGAEGLNASIGTTIVLIALILPLLPRRRDLKANPVTA